MEEMWLVTKIERIFKIKHITTILEYDHGFYQVYVSLRCPPSSEPFQALRSQLKPSFCHFYWKGGHPNVKISSKIIPKYINYPRSPKNTIQIIYIYLDSYYESSQSKNTKDLSEYSPSQKKPSSQKYPPRNDHILGGSSQVS